MILVCAAPTPFRVHSHLWAAAVGAATPPATATTTQSAAAADAGATAAATATTTASRAFPSPDRTGLPPHSSSHPSLPVGPHPRSALATAAVRGGGGVLTAVDGVSTSPFVSLSAPFSLSLYVVVLLSCPFLSSSARLQTRFLAKRERARGLRLCGS